MNTLLIKSAFRQLWKNKLFTLLNIIGLTIGITSCWVIFKIVYYEFSFESGVPDAQNSYRLISHFVNEGKDNYNSGVSRPLYQGIEKDIAGVDKVIPLFKNYSIAIAETGKGSPQALSFEDFSESTASVWETNNAYFGMVGYKWLAGTESNAFKHPDAVVLTSKRASLYFPNVPYEQLIGKTILYNDSLNKTISGVVENLTFPSEFGNLTEFIPLKSTVYSSGEWTNTNGSDRLYIQVNPKTNIAAVTKSINELARKKWLEFKNETKPKYDFQRTIEAYNLKEYHFTSHIKDWESGKTSMNTMYGMMAVGAFLLLLACINYINLNTAMIPGRSKEIGVRKTLGSSRKNLIAQIMTESLITVGLAVSLSVLFSKLVLSYFSDMIPEVAVSYSSGLAITVFIILLMVLIITLSTAYPAWLINKVKPVNLFRANNQLQIGNSQINIRKGLIVFQFFIAQFFTVSALIIGQQLSFTVHKDLGFEKEAVVLLDIPYKLLGKMYEGKIDGGKKKVLANEISKIQGVKFVSIGSAPISNNYSSSLLSLENETNEKESPSAIVYFKSADNNYLNVYNMPLLAGKKLLPSDTTNSYIINMSAVKAFGFKNPTDAIGKRIGQGKNLFPIVGVVKDFHAQDFYNAITPVALNSNLWSANTLNIKLNGDSKTWKSTIEKINATFKNIFPEYEAETIFFDKNIDNMYQKEQNLFKMINISTIVAILIGCLGLFGLVTLSAFQRAKEIGIRKVLGASIPNIFKLLSVNFMQLILISIAFSTPLIWWFASKWLEDFVYRIQITPWPFVLGAIIAVVAALLTISYQALKAAFANPVDSLRDE